MTRDFAYESSLLVEVHPLQVRFIIREDLVGLRNDPDLYDAWSVGYLCRHLRSNCTCLGAVIFDNWSRKVLDGFPLEQHLGQRCQFPIALFASMSHIDFIHDSGLNLELMRDSKRTIVLHEMQHAPI